MDEKIEPIHRRISELKSPITIDMSNCSTKKFQSIISSHNLSFVETQWNLLSQVFSFSFEWDDRREPKRMPDILTCFQNALPNYQFQIATNVGVSVSYSPEDIVLATFNGYLDLLVFLPGVVASLPLTKLAQCICHIEIKKGPVTHQHFNQVCLQLIAINASGNHHRPFALLTNLTDNWRFVYIKDANVIGSILFTDRNSGLTAFQEALNMFAGGSSSCPFASGTGGGFNLLNSGSGNDDEMADMAEFYEDMTIEEIQQNQQKAALNKLFKMMSSSQLTLFAQDNVEKVA